MSPTYQTTVHHTYRWNVLCRYVGIYHMCMNTKSTSNIKSTLSMRLKMLMNPCSHNRRNTSHYSCTNEWSLPPWRPTVLSNPDQYIKLLRKSTTQYTYLSTVSNWTKSSEEIWTLCMHVAIDSVEGLSMNACQHLAHCRLAATCLTNKQHRFLELKSFGWNIRMKEQ